MIGRLNIVGRSSSSSTGMLKPIAVGSGRLRFGGSRRTSAAGLGAPGSSWRWFEFGPVLTGHTSFSHSAREALSTSMRRFCLQVLGCAAARRSRSVSVGRRFCKAADVAWFAACCSLSSAVFEEGLLMAAGVLCWRFQVALQRNQGGAEVVRQATSRCWRGGRLLWMRRTVGGVERRAAMRRFSAICSMVVMSRRCIVIHGMGAALAGRAYCAPSVRLYCVGAVLSLVCAFQFAVTFRIHQAFWLFSVWSMSPWCRSLCPQAGNGAAQASKCFPVTWSFIVAALCSSIHCGAFKWPIGSGYQGAAMVIDQARLERQLVVRSIAWLWSPGRRRGSGWVGTARGWFRAAVGPLFRRRAFEGAARFDLSRGMCARIAQVSCTCCEFRAISFLCCSCI